MGLHGKYVVEKNGSRFIGEHSSENQLYGKGIRISAKGEIYIGNNINGTFAPGNYIYIYSKRILMSLVRHYWKVRYT